MSEFDAVREKAKQMEALVEHWFFEAFHGSLVARSTEIFNAVHDAKEELKHRLAGFVVDLSQDLKKD